MEFLVSELKPGRDRTGERFLGATSIGLALLAMIGAAGVVSDQAVVPAGILAFVSFYAGTAALIWPNRRLRRRAWEPLVKVLQRERRISVADDSITSRTDTVTLTLLWGAIEDLTEHAGMLLARYEGGGLLAIPRRAVTDPDSIRAYISQRLGRTS
ncbi:YcxB family protein [Inquilinus limosus]|uniref:YcxB family protein n=1 Tax=Inquilinus limosus TaxID=171674 RepID=UPI003F1727C3